MAYPFDDTYPPEFGAGIVQQNLPWADRDWMGTGDPFTPMQPRMGPAPQFDVPTPNFYAPPVQEQVPDDFFTRLARSQGPTPFQFQPRQGNNARGIDVILAALQGFANARTAGATRGAMDVEQRNKQRSEGARLMAEERWRQAKFRQDTLQNRQRIAASQAAEAGRDERLGRTIAAQGDRQDKAIAAASERTDKLIAARPGQNADSDEIGEWAENVANGTVALTSAPIRIRGQIQKFMRSQGMKIKPDKVRKAEAELSTGESLLDQLENYSRTVNVGVTPKTRPVKALGTAAGIVTQSNLPAAQMETAGNGLVPAVARAIGHTGVLTQKDVDLTRELLPSPYDTEERAAQKIAALRAHFANMRSRVSAAYTQRSGAGAGGAGVANGQSTGQPMSDEEAYQRYLKIVGGKK